MAVKKTDSAFDLDSHKAFMDELVEIKLFKDTGRYKDDVFVSVNGDNVLIKRGEKVLVKRKFAEVLEASDRQDLETAALMAGQGQLLQKALSDKALL